MNGDDLSKLIDTYVEEIGLEQLKKTLVHELNQRKLDDYSLTIIANQSFHDIPSRFVHGELYIASSGSLNFENKEIIIEQYQEILLNLRKKLSEKEWKKVYLVPTGHSTLALQIKSLVYHVLRIDTVDLFYSKGDYYEIEINLRSWSV
ncbi:hypothetical protein [Anabaena sp. CCY 9910]|uniref:hypothetical protein n=1 Tax=Anabaena sp. CCY 9910 TaxID=3103870 RepID=UPI0039DFC192